MKQRLLICLAAVALVSACSRQTTQDVETQEINKLNSAPQQHYPAFTLDQQRAAMKLLEESRRQRRVEGLREKSPPADWIQFAYHGLLVDANYDVIELNPENVAKIQESMFSIPTACARPSHQQIWQRFGPDVQ